MSLSRILGLKQRSLKLDLEWVLRIKNCVENKAEIEERMNIPREVRAKRMPFWTHIPYFFSKNTACVQKGHPLRHISFSLISPIYILSPFSAKKASGWQLRCWCHCHVFRHDESPTPLLPLCPSEKIKSQYEGSLPFISQLSMKCSPNMLFQNYFLYLFQYAFFNKFSR